MKRISLPFASVVLATSLAACGGGGGSSSGSPVPVTPTAAPAQTASVAGKVTDCVWPTAPTTAAEFCSQGSAISGAMVVYGTTLIVGATPPPTLPAGDVQTTTATDGSFTITNAPTGTNEYVEVFPATGDAHVTLHALLGVTYNGQTPVPRFAAGQTTTYNFSLLIPAPEESTWLNAPCGPNGGCGMNADRAKTGLPPLVFDEFSLEAARNWANVMGSTPYFGDPPDPYVTGAAQYPGNLEALRGGNPNAAGYVVSTGGPVSNANVLDGEQNFETENTTPPGPHWQIITNPNLLWVGLARYPCASTAHGCNANTYVYTGLLNQPG